MPTTTTSRNLPDAATNARQRTGLWHSQPCPVVAQASTLAPNTATHEPPQKARLAFAALSAFCRQHTFCLLSPLCAAFSCLVMLMVCPLPAQTQNVIENAIKINHVTKLNSVDFICKKPAGTKAEGAKDKRRTNVGIGEEITLTIAQIKTPSGVDFKGDERNITWTITEGDAYFGYGVSGDALNNKVLENRDEALLNIRVKNTGAPVKVVVTTVPTGTNVPPGCIAEAEVVFTVFKPEDVVARHAPGQEDISLGTYLKSVLQVFPKPTFVNFGGAAENGVWVTEHDENELDGDKKKAR